MKKIIFFVCFLTGHILYAQQPVIRYDSLFLSNLQHDANLIVSGSRGKILNNNEKGFVGLMNSAIAARKWTVTQFNEFIKNINIQRQMETGLNEADGKAECLSLCNNDPGRPCLFDKAYTACCLLWCEWQYLKGSISHFALKIKLGGNLLLMQ